MSFSVALDFSGETTPVADTLPGGIQALIGANWQHQADADDPTKYYTKLDPSNGPALWMDVGQSDEVKPQVEKLAGQLKAKGFTVELHTRPGAHDFTTFGLAFKDALPWATARFYS